MKQLSIEKFNLRAVQSQLGTYLGQESVASLSAEIDSHCVALFALGLSHYNFSKRCTRRQWRQAISRLYYAGYNVSRAVRLHEAGVYSTKVDDHQKFDQFSDKFPNRARYADRLAVLRGDRNLADYGHVAKASDLIIKRVDADDLVCQFIADARSFLSSRGLTV